MDKEKIKQLDAYIKSGVSPILIENIPIEVFEDEIIIDSNCDRKLLNGHYEGINFVAPEWYNQLINKTNPILIINEINKISTNEQIKEDMKTRCPMNQLTVMFKKDKVETVGGYIDWYCDEDYYLWLRLMLSGAKFANCDTVLCNVRIGEEMFDRRGGWKYFKSEAKLQKWMLDQKVIGFGTYLINVTKRLIVQVLLPNKIRGWVFKKFARRSA